MRRSALTLSQEELKKFLHYDPYTGVFIRIAGANKRSHNRFYGKIAGTDSGHGYRLIFVSGGNYYAHRLAWFYVHGEWPDIIDHIDGDRANNRIGNLRICSKRENGCNRPAPRNNTSGFKGVIYHKASRKYAARIGSSGKSIHLGLFVTAEEAAYARNQAAIRLYGDFARSA